MQATTTPATRRTGNTHRWVRQIHLWIGAWGALAAILYGLTGLVMNHRFGDAAWPQGDSRDGARTTLQVPADATTSAEALSLWLARTQGLHATTIRKGPPRAAAPGAPERWNLSGGNASHAWAIDYAPGAAQAELKRSDHSPLAAFNRLHKGVGGGKLWILLADSFAIGMLLLGITGMWMWLRGRGPREMLQSVLAISLLATGAVLGLALL